MFLSYNDLLLSLKKSLKLLYSQSNQTLVFKFLQVKNHFFSVYQIKCVMRNPFVTIDDPS